MPPEYALDGLSQVLQQVPAVRDLHGPGGSLRRRLGVGRRTIPADDFDAGMGLEPRGHGVRVAVGEEVDNVTAFQVHDDRAVPLPLAPGPVIDPHTTRGDSAGVDFRRLTRRSNVSGLVVIAMRGEAGTGFTAQRQADVVSVCLSRSVVLAHGAANPRETLGEDASWAVGLWACERRTAS